MRITQTLLLATVAVLALPSCSSAQGPGEIGTTDDIVVRNYGDAPLPPTATETVLQQDANASPEMMATRTPEPVKASADVNSPANPDIPPNADTSTSMAETAEPQGSAVDAVPAPDVQTAPSAPLAEVSATTTTTTAVSTPPLEEAGLGNESLATRPATTEAGTMGIVSPETTDAAMDTRPAPQVDPMGQTVDSVDAPAVQQAAEEYQNKGSEQAAAEAMQNPPTPYGAQLTNPAATAPRAPGEAQVSQPTPPVTNYGMRTSSFQPSSEDYARGGMRVVKTQDGQLIEKDYQGSMTTVPANAPAAPVMPAPEMRAAPVMQKGGAPITDKAMMTRAQTVLSEKGFYSGPANGEMSTDMLNALSRYQAANGLTPGGMTVETAQHMGLVQ